MLPDAITFIFLIPNFSTRRIDFMKTTTDSNKELINGGLFVLGPGIFG